MNSIQRVVMIASLH